MDDDILVIAFAEYDNFLQYIMGCASPKYDADRTSMTRRSSFG